MSHFKASQCHKYAAVSQVRRNLRHLKRVLVVVSLLFPLCIRKLRSFLCSYHRSNPHFTTSLVPVLDSRLCASERGQIMIFADQHGCKLTAKQ